MGHLTSRDAYKTLEDRINWFTQGAPPSETLTKILKLLFTEKEAKWVAMLPIRPFSLKKAAATLGVNPNYLCTAFREDTGYRVTQYLNFVRLKQALYSITYNDFNVTEACEAAGYDNINTFAAAFRKYVGVNPSIYRKYCIAAINAKVLDLSTEPVFSSLHTPLKEQMDSMASLGEKIRRVF